MAQFLVLLGLALSALLLAASALTRRRPQRAASRAKASLSVRSRP